MTGKKENWTILRQKKVYNAQPYLEVFKQKVQLPTGKIIDDYHYIWMPDTVNVVAETTDHKIIMFEEYRHGFGKFVHTFPGGHVEKNVTPEKTAINELYEETSYIAKDVALLGKYKVNPSYDCGDVYFFYAKDVYLSDTQVNDDDLETKYLRLVEKEYVKNLVVENKIESLAYAMAAQLWFEKCY